MNKRIFFGITTSIKVGIALLISGVILTNNTCAHDENMDIAGWIENAVLFPSGAIVHAKLDTGAKTSSINAVNPAFYSQDGKRWVRFSLTNRKQRIITIESPVVRTATIKRHFNGSQERPVIQLDICVGKARKTVEVNLVDRTGLNYQLLIGRNFLKNNLLIKSGSTYLLPPACPGS